MPFNFNDEVGDVEAPQEGSTKFAKIGLYILNFAKGGPFNLPGVFYDQYDNDTKMSTRIGLKEFKREPLRGKVDLSKPTLCIIVLECENSEGGTYQIIKQCDNYLMKNGNVDEEGKEETINFFKDLQYPELKAAEGEGALEVLANADAPERWVYGQATLLDSEIVTTYGPTRKYLGDFVIYSNEKTWRAASEKFYTPAGEREEDTWISAELENLVHEATDNAWAGSLDLLKETAIEVDGALPPVQKAKLGIKDAELRQEVIDRAVGKPIEAEVIAEDEIPF